MPTAEPPPAWSTGQRPNALAALPRGMLGRVGGWLMGRTSAGRQHEVLAVAEVRPGERVLEVGHGPGVLLAALASTKAALVVGVDPSAEMRAAAGRRNTEVIRSGRMRIAAGSADATGQPDAAFDLVLSVNTVAIWPDLDGGVRELARVVRPGGRLVLSWHGGTDPGRFTRKLTLPEPLLDRIEAALRAEFGAVDRIRTRHCEVFRAVRGPGGDVPGRADSEGASRRT